MFKMNIYIYIELIVGSGSGIVGLESGEGNRRRYLYRSSRWRSAGSSRSRDPSRIRRHSATHARPRADGNVSIFNTDSHQTECLLDLLGESFKRCKEVSIFTCTPIMGICFLLSVCVTKAGAVPALSLRQCDTCILSSSARPSLPFPCL